MAKDDLQTVKVPDALKPVFLKAQEQVSRYFENMVLDPTHGTIEISGDRYVLVRAASLSTEFFDLVASLRENLSQEQARKVAGDFLFDLAHAIGKADATQFHERLGLEDPLDKLSTGPVHFAHTGWAFVDILPESRPSADEDFFLVYDHPYSFEAETWIGQNKASRNPVCVMNAGYSSGWCENSFGVTLVAVEIECRAAGDDRCRFVMAPPNRIEEAVARYRENADSPSRKSLGLELPSFLHSDHLKKELRQERDFSAAVLDTVSALVAVLDANGLLLSCNRSCEDVTGYTTREVHGKRIEDIFLTGQNAIAWSQVVEGILSGTSPGIHESTWTTRAGEKKRISWSFSVLSGPDRRLRYVVCTGTDITERDQLQKQLGRRVDELARVNLRLAEVNKELDSFAYAVSHDLRTPLRGMEGMAYALLDSVSSSLDEKDREFARRIAGSARQMDTLVQDLLAYSRVNQDQIQLERVELDLVVTDVLGKLQDTIDREQAEVAVLSPLPTLTSHRAILLQVVENLMANAIKFVAPGKTAQVEIGARAKDGAMRLWVKDKGIGIEPKHHETIFQALERLHDIESYPGTGIGLALVRRGIERLGGRVGVESAPGEGSLFWVELPLKA